MSTPTFAPSSRDAETFYENYVQHHVPYHLNSAGLKGWILHFLPYWSWREWRFWKRYVPTNGVLLDLGSARGREVFAARSGASIGLDIAPTALKECAQHYQLASRSNLFPIPLRDRSADCVVTSHVLGHVAAEEKDRVLAEIARVLKPGGNSIHVVETDSTHPLVTFAKHYPDLYQRYFVEPDGHIGAGDAGGCDRAFRASRFAARSLPQDGRRSLPSAPDAETLRQRASPPFGKG